MQVILVGKVPGQLPAVLRDAEVFVINELLRYPNGRTQILRVLLKRVNNIAECSIEALRATLEGTIRSYEEFNTEADFREPAVFNHVIPETTCPLLPESLQVTDSLQLYQYRHPHNETVLVFVPPTYCQTVATNGQSPS